MKTLYFDCGMGAAGDMLTAALLELFDNQEEIVHELNHLGIPHVEFVSEKTQKCGITGTHMHVKIYGMEEDTDMGTHSSAHHEMTVHEHEHTPEHHHDHEHSHEHEYHHDHAHNHGHECSHKHAHFHEHHHDHEHSHNHEHHHDHEHSHNHEHHHEHEHSYNHEHRHDHEHSHNHEHHYEHEHSHNHEHRHDHEHSHNHEHHHDHEHHGMSDITQIVSRLHINDTVKHHVLAVYHLIAEAESHAHGVPVEQIHFHEVGNMDAIADVTAFCYLFDKLQIDQAAASSVHVGSGQVKCAHGILPVPAPATAHILKGVPVYGGQIRGELCTPTGAAILKHFVSQFGQMPAMSIDAIGYGMGKKDFAAANCVRAMLGTTEDSTDSIAELSCNIDDMTGEELGFAMEQLLHAGALDVFTMPIQMKKNRPGTLFTVFCRPEDRQNMVRLIFKYTTTLGIRENLMNRYRLERNFETIDTPHGTIHRKTASGYGVHRSKLEFDDLARIAKEENITLREVSAKYTPNN